MKVVYFPHKGQNRPREGDKWKKGLHWGADFMLNAFQKFAPEEIEIAPCYELTWNNIREADIVWLHNIATTGITKTNFMGITTPFKKWRNKPNRPKFIGGVRGFEGLRRSKNVLQFFDAVHIGTEDLKVEAIKYNPNSYVLFPGVDFELFSPPEKPPGPPFTIGWCGDVRKKMKNIEIVMALDYPMILATKENYIPHDRMPKDFFHKIHTFVHPSSHEGGNRTIIEAAACGLPIITTDTGTASTIVAERYIINLEGDTVSEISELLKELEENPELAKRIGMENRERAKVYDWKPITETWVKILKSVL
jgi:hypothetical protein